LKNTNRAWIYGLALLCAIATAALGYRDTFGEPDMGSMVVGIVYGAVTGDPLAGGLQYGMPFSFGFYRLLYWLIAPGQLSDPEHVTRVINYVGLAFSGLFALNLGLLLSRLLGRGAALFATATFLFSPLAIPFLASGHPFIGSCAFLFLGCWLLLLAAEATPAWRWAALLAALAALVVSLTLRGDIALAFPFLPAMYWAQQRQGLSACWRRLALICAVVTAAFITFLVLQHPYVASKGGAGGSLRGFLDKFASFDHLDRGLVVFAMALGAGTAASIGFGVLRLLRGSRPDRRIILALGMLAVPSLLFWLPTPQPARHFLLPVLALYVLAAVLWADRLAELKRAVACAVLVILSNQLLAEAIRPAVVGHYPWAYPSEGPRRATQQVPIGISPLDQRANINTQARFHEEAQALARSRPEHLLFMGDTLEYVVAALLAADHSLRIIPCKVGPIDAMLLTNGRRQLYVMNKRFVWPRDALALVQTLPDYAAFPIYVQPATLSRYDISKVSADRAYRLTY